MNILPKKRWHVRTKDNIARVRRDEANAAEEEKERLRRAKLAEQEARTALLRGRSTGNNVEEKKKDTSDDSKTTADIYTAEGNINFFKQLETGGGMCNGITNKEHEKEEKDEKEKYEKKIGLLTYLGQDTIESTNGKEWYHDNSKCVSALLTAKQDTNDEENAELGLKSKRNLDPLKDILKYTAVKKKVDFKDSQRIDINAPVEMVLPSEKKIRKLKKLMKRKERMKNKCKRKMKSSHKEKKCKRKRHESESDSDDRKSHHSDKRRRHKKSKRRADSSSSSSSESENKEEQRKKINEMRKKRVAREEEEKRRTQTFLAGNVSKPDSPPVRQKYNSQFNPLLAKQNKS